MFVFNKRKIHVQRGSNLISVPIEWIKSGAKDCKAVIVQMDQDNNFVIAPGEV